MVAEQFEGLLETVEIVGTDQHRSGSTVAGDDDAFVFAVRPLRARFRRFVLEAPEVTLTASSTSRAATAVAMGTLASRP